MTLDGAAAWPTTTLSAVATSISSGTSVNRLQRGKYPLYGSTGQIGYTNEAACTGASILVARVGANAGSVYRVDGAYGVSDNTLLVRLKAGRSVEFFEAVLSAQNLNALVYGSGQPLVTGTMLKRLRVPDLTPAEESAVAESLHDAKALIAGLNRLIAKKQAIKQGIAQELLTGRTRLPGYTSKWRTVRLADVLTVRHGKSQRAVEAPTGKYPILATGGQIGWTDTPLHTKPSVLIGRKGTIDRPQYQDQPFWTVDTLFYTEIALTADPRFLYYVFLTIDWRSMNEASGVPSLSASRVESVKVELPELTEQIAIRQVLCNADAEIDLLKLRLEKTQAIKEGMAQQLLTGKRRLTTLEGMA